MSEGLKELGTKAFQERDFERAIELYTRAIEQEDRANNHVLFSNRSAAKVRLTSNVVFWWIEWKRFSNDDLLMMKRPSVLSARVVQELALVFMRSLKLSERVRVFVVLCVCARDRFRTANDLRAVNSCAWRLAFWTESETSERVLLTSSLKLPFDSFH